MNEGSILASSCHLASKHPTHVQDIQMRKVNAKVHIQQRPHKTPLEATIRCECHTGDDCGCVQHNPAQAAMKKHQICWANEAEDEEASHEPWIEWHQWLVLQLHFDDELQHPIW